jgi:hypothetical protein
MHKVDPDERQFQDNVDAIADRLVAGVHSREDSSWSQNDELLDLMRDT